MRYPKHTQSPACANPTIRGYEECTITLEQSDGANYGQKDSAVAAAAPTVPNELAEQEREREREREREEKKDREREKQEQTSRARASPCVYPHSGGGLSRAQWDRDKQTFYRARAAFSLPLSLSLFLCCTYVEARLPADMKGRESKNGDRGTRACCACNVCI